MAMNFHHGRESQSYRLRVEGGEGFIRQDPCDEKDSVGPRRPSLKKLDPMDYEVFSEYGKVHSTPNLPQIVQGSPEKLRVREDADGSRPGTLILTSQIGRHQLRPNGSSPRGATFHLCHHGHFPPPVKGQGEISAWGGIPSPFPESYFLGKEGFHFLPLGLDDPVEDVGPPIKTLRFGQRSGILYSVLVRVLLEEKGTMPLTKRQKEILDYIHGFIDEHGYAPSFEEIAHSFGYSSLATVHEHLSNLERKGYIRKSYNESRSIEMVPEDGTVSAMELPLLGTVAAGLPIEAIQDQESLAVPLDMVRPGKDNFVLRVQGNSMIDEQIRDGDYIVVSSQPTASDGEVVVALVGGDSVTVKRIFREAENRVRLQPANPSMDPIVVDAGDVRVQGVVVGLIRRF
jgi:repressor LexA